MPAKADFLQAILAAPDQDAPRLIYADWLEEHGDPRGQFIRLQIASEKLQVGSTECKALDAECDELLDQYEDEWIGDILRRRATWRFRRGFVDHIVVPAVYLQSFAEAIWAREPVVSVDVTNLNNFAEAIAGIPELTNVRRLNIGLNRVGDEALLPFTQSPYLARLESLTAWDCRLGDESAVAIARSPHLSQLRVLDLSNNVIRSRGGMALARSPYLQHLRHLRLYRNEIGVDATEELRQRFRDRLTLF